jgi:hypothetical protein
MMERIERVADREKSLAARAVETFGPEVAQAVEEARSKHGYTPPQGPLEEAVGGTNIHEFLCKQVYQVEASEAAVVEAIRKSVGSQADELLLSTAANHGRSSAKSLQAGSPDEEANLTDIASALYRALLDGMPCDQATRLIEETPEKVVFHRSLEVHRPAWEAVGADTAFMATLIGRWAEGFIKALNPRTRFQRTIHLEGETAWCIDELTLDHHEEGE